MPAGTTLYFTNQEQRSCWPVRNVLGNPTTVAVTRKGVPYRNEFQSVMKLPLVNNLGIAEVVMPAVLSNLNVGGVPPPFGTLVSIRTDIEPTISHLSDSVAGTAPRQSDVIATHWHCTVSPAVEGDPTLMLVSIDQYPDGYSNDTPSWWTDPKAT